MKRISLIFPLLGYSQQIHKLASFALVNSQVKVQGRQHKQQAGTGRTTKSTSLGVVSSGLHNLGNTCYLNAQMQCAYHIPYVRKMIISPTMSQEQDVVDCPTDGSTSDSSNNNNNIGLWSLRQVFSSMATSSLPVSPLVFCQSLGINVFEQQDSQEFWKLLLPLLELPKLTDLYQGAFEDYIVAQDDSGRERRKEEPFLDLSLEVQSGSVMKSMKETFSQPELLSEAEGNGWRPEKGADKVDALKGSLLRVHGLSSILQLHLKRFQYDWNTDRMSKINDPFTFPKELDLSTICQDISDTDAPFAFYDLQSVVVHAGGYGNGHYYSYVRPDVTSSSWYRFDDNRVTKVKYSEVVRDSFGGRQEQSKKKSKQATTMEGERKKRSFWGNIFGDGARDLYGYGGRHSSAYMLQYVRRCDVPTLYGGLSNINLRTIQSK